MCWALSALQASRHFEDCCLVTDLAGAELLSGELALPFTSVSTALETLNERSADPQWWVLGKLSAYAAQTEAFLHLDADVILWKRPPSHLLQARVIAQNPEHFDFEDQSLYRADQFMRAIAACDGWLPEAWRAYAERRRNGALCCGIFGGADVNFIRNYAGLAIEIIDHPRNVAAWEMIGIRDNILVEQYFLAAYIEAAAGGAADGAADGGDAAAYLFPSSQHAFDPAIAAAQGYTHLIGDAKADAEIARRVERRVLAEDPALHHRCVRASESRRGILSRSI